MPGIEYIPLTVTDIVAETEDVKSFRLATQNGEILPYRAGQFLSFDAGNGSRRSYSFASAPGIDDYMQIAVKRIDNSLFSRKLHDTIKEGDILYSTGVSGMFTLPDDVSSYSTLCFFAAGVGIAPVFSLIKAALEHEHLNIVLFYSNRSVAETVFYNELTRLENQYAGRVKIIHLFSSSPNLQMARLNKELVPRLLESFLNDADNTLFYVCGPYPYMRMVIYALEEMHIPAIHIKKENFDTTITTYKPTPPDRGRHTVHLVYGSETYNFTSGYPDTVLQSAEKQGISLPYSCRNGVCGTCAARCISGKVWHSANEVLTDAELADGMILTCTAYPVGGDIKLLL